MCHFFKPCGKIRVWGLGCTSCDKTTWKQGILKQIYNLGSTLQFFCLTVNGLAYCQTNATAQKHCFPNDFFLFETNISPISHLLVIAFKTYSESWGMWFLTAVFFFLNPTEHVAAVLSCTTPSIHFQNCLSGSQVGLEPIEAVTGQREATLLKGCSLIQTKGCKQRTHISIIMLHKQDNCCLHH